MTIRSTRRRPSLPDHLRRPPAERGARSAHDRAADRAARGAAGGPVIETHQTAGGTRVSTIRRPDGSTLTVRVPMAAMADEAGSGHWPENWITGDAPREPSPSALRRLASAVTVGPSPSLAIRPGIPLMAVR